jgi:hypothetical protein
MEVAGSSETSALPSVNSKYHNLKIRKGLFLLYWIDLDIATNTCDFIVMLDV